MAHRVGHILVSYFGDISKAYKARFPQNDDEKVLHKNFQ
jgi:hypothetical protein